MLPVLIALLLFVGIIFIVKPGSTTEPVFKQPKPTKDITVVALGDSLTKGVGDPEKRGYVGDVGDRLKEKQTIGKVQTYNYGIKGDTSDDLLEKLKSEDVLNRVEKANLIVFTIGGNDLMDVVENHFLGLTSDLFRQKKKRYQKNLEEAFQILRNHNKKAQIVYIGVFNPFSAYFPDVKETKQIIQNWNRTGKETTEPFQNAEYVSIFDLFEDGTANLISNDHFHPNAQGYKLIAQRVIKKIDIQRLSK